MKRNDKIHTPNGIETVAQIDGVRVLTYESMARLTWYHISKVAAK